MKFQVKSVKLNFIMNFIMTASSIIFPLITFPYISRTLLASGSGAVSSAASVVSYFIMFASLGIPTYGIRACAKVRDNRDELSKTVRELFIINSITTAITCCVFISIVLWIPRFSNEKELFLINGVSIIFNLIGVPWLYSALEEYVYITSRTLMFKAISIIMMFLMVKQPNDYIVYAAISVFAGGGSYILNFIRMFRYVDFTNKIKLNLKRHLKPIFVFFATAAGISVYTNLDTVMLWFMKSNTEVGYYTAGIKVKVLLTMLVTSLGTVLLPRLSYYIEKKNQTEFQRIVAKACNFVLILGTAVTVYFFLFSKESILFLAGKDFYGAITPMKYLMPTVLFVGLSNVTGIQVLTPRGCEMQVLYSIIAGAVTDFTLNLILIPIFSANGAALATTIAEGVVLFVQCMFLKNDIKNIFADVSVCKILVSVVMASISASIIKFIHFPNTFLILLVSALVYFSVYGVSLYAQKEKFVLEIIHYITKQLKFYTSKS